MGFEQFTAPMGWLLIDLLLGLAVLVVYHLLPPSWLLPIRNLRWVLVPYLALLSGGVSPRFMGLTGIDWLASFGLGFGLVAAVVGLLVLVRSTTDFSPPTEADTTPEALGKRHYQPITIAPFFYAGAEEFHWSFLRGVIAEILQGATPPTGQAFYWAIWLAALLALPETIRMQSTLLTRLFKATLLILTTVLFTYTRNFWLCWLLHGLVLLLLMPQNWSNRAAVQVE
jgi:hypothetical protein